MPLLLPRRRFTPDMDQPRLDWPPYYSPHLPPLDFASNIASVEQILRFDSYTPFLSPPPPKKKSNCLHHSRFNDVAFSLSLFSPPPPPPQPLFLSRVNLYLTPVLYFSFPKPTHIRGCTDYYFPLLSPSLTRVEKKFQASKEEFFALRQPKNKYTHTSPIQPSQKLPPSRYNPLYCHPQSNIRTEQKYCRSSSQICTEFSVIIGIKYPPSAISWLRSHAHTHTRR